MLKTVSSITNAIGALNFKGTWNASTNTPTLTSGVGVKGDYFVVSTAGTTNLDGISTWGIGDWATYNGTVWQRVEGGADLEGVNLSVSGTTNLAALTASTAMALDANKNVVSVTNTGTGNNVLGTSPTMATPTLTGDVQMSTGNLVVGTSGKGIDFSATPSTGTSELLADYEEGTWTPAYAPGTGSFTSIGYGFRTGQYVKIGDMVFVSWRMRTSALTVGSASGAVFVTGLPFAAGNVTSVDFALGIGNDFASNNPGTGRITNLSSSIELQQERNNISVLVSDLSTGAANNFSAGFACYRAT
jgi:hypothetical protein